MKEKLRGGGRPAFCGAAYLTVSGTVKELVALVELVVVTAML
jgi:hypothetical protein